MQGLRLLNPPRQLLLLAGVLGLGEGRLQGLDEQPDGLEPVRAVRQQEGVLLVDLEDERVVVQGQALQVRGSRAAATGVGVNVPPSISFIRLLACDSTSARCWPLPVSLRYVTASMHATARSYGRF